MADDLGNEILMQLVDSGGRKLAAECQTEVKSDLDALLWDYQAGTFFTVDDFAFGMNIDDQDAATDTVNNDGGPKLGGASPKALPAAQGKFGKWKSGSPDDIKKITPFPLRMDEFSITRRFDKASPVLFQSCARSATFRSASMVKRKTVGQGKLQTFFRMDFKQLMVTHVGWDDAEVIKETMRFVFRELTVQYRQQAHDGSLMAAATVDWSYDMALRT